jgi:hypothetical protein
MVEQGEEDRTGGKSRRKKGGATYDWQASETLIRGLSRSSCSLAFNSVNRLNLSSAIVCFFSLTAPAE